MSRISAALVVSSLLTWPIALITATQDVAAQTTWRSFEDRENHSMVPEPNGAGLLLFGGVEPGTTSYLNDTWQRDTAGDWLLEPPTSVPPSARSAHGMAVLDTGVDASAVAVVFGGFGESGRNDETWCWTNEGWIRELPFLSPSARQGHAMVGDPDRNVVLLFGGLDNTGSLNDTWEYDGAAWSQRTLSASPSARFGHAITRDSDNDKILLFGGNGALGDFWEFEHANNRWVQLAPGGSLPGGRTGAAMAYDLNNRRVVLFGGRDGLGNALGDTWTYDSLTNLWTQRMPLTSPPARYGHEMAYDSSANGGFGAVVMVGGRDPAGGQVLRGTWEWNGTDWAEANQPPSGRTGAAITFEGVNPRLRSSVPHRDRALLFGGSVAGTPSDETWELTGATWDRRLPPAPPPGRTEAGLAYAFDESNPSQQLTFLFGGNANGMGGCSPLGDMWKWDGSGWLPVALTVTPEPATGPMVYDAERKQIVLLAPDSNGTSFETWLFDPASETWTNAPRLGESIGSAATYDPQIQRVVLFGGTGPSSGLSNDTWLWDGSRWSPASPTTSPPPVIEASLVYDLANQRGVLFGGLGTIGGVPNSVSNETWLWDGSDWQEATPATSPPARERPTMAYHAANQRTVLFGGWDNSGMTAVVFGDTWEWNGTNWSQASPSTSPPARYSHAVAFDAGRNRTVLYGGVDSAGADLKDTWEWNGTEWAEVVTANAPDIARHMGMWFDETRGTVMLQGGEFGVGSLRDETWEFDGTDWTQIMTATSPEARKLHVLAYDTDRDRAVRFGGTLCKFWSDTWEFDGTDWIQQSSGTHPPFRTGHGMAYDASRGRVVVFGGELPCDVVNPCAPNFRGIYQSPGNVTWEWDGTGWQDFRPTPSTTIPAHLHHMQMVFDDERDRVVLFGGVNEPPGMPPVTLGDTWEWDGSTWRPGNPTNSPSVAAGHAMVYDTARKQTVLLDTDGETWAYSPLEAAVYAEFAGPGCAGAPGTPILEVAPGKAGWIGEPMTIQVRNVVPTQISFLFFGIPLAAPTPILGCELFVNPLINVPALNDANGVGEVSFIMPNDPALVGGAFWNQALAVDPGGPGGVAFSPGTIAIVGRK